MSSTAPAPQETSSNTTARGAQGARRLWIIDPSVYVAEDQGVESILRAWDGAYRVLRPAMNPQDAEALDPERGYADVAAVVVMGSAASVHDEVPWLDALKAWIRPILAGEEAVPLLGLCFGHQLIGHLSGGRVGYLRDDHTKRVGVEESTALAGNRLIPAGERLRVIVSHREHVADAPDPARYAVTATRPGVAVDGLQHRRLPIFGVQFHPEARQAFAERVGIDLQDIDARLIDDGQRILRAFTRLISTGLTSTGPSQ